MRLVAVLTCGLLALAAQPTALAAKTLSSGEASASERPARSLAARRAEATRRLNLAAPVYGTPLAQSETAPEPAAGAWPDMSRVQLAPYAPETLVQPQSLGVSIQLSPRPEASHGPASGPSLTEDLDADSRWYLFAAVRGRALGLSILRDSEGSAYQDWAAERMASVGDAHVGVGWRDGPYRLSFGYVWRNMRQRDPFFNMISPRRDEMAAVSFSIRAEPPSRRQGQPEP